MGCSSCGRRVQRITYGGQREVMPDPTPTDSLSAARLTPMGWVSTCTKCGTQSLPQPFPDSITPACMCKRD
ncbi:hypothetical protein fHeYen902_135 [Yersinia phage fHe-Yen9-02]|nr:hypothetical protein fHeYen902_135 [Yersinia phage fHe-Yen9-02]